MPYGVKNQRTKTSEIKKLRMAIGLMCCLMMKLFQYFISPVTTS